MERQNDNSESPDRKGEREVFRPTIRAPPLGKRILLHQALSGKGRCYYCDKPVDDWSETEECPVKYC